METPRRLAEDTLQRLLADENNAIAFPVNPYEVAAKLGIAVWDADLKPGVSGVIVKNDGDPAPQIYLNRSDSANRKRFTCAHEIGHFLTRQSNEDFGYVDWRDEVAGRGEDEAEIMSNKFAAELLMPASVVREWWAEGEPVHRLARRFGVSEAAMNFRLRNLHLT